MFLLTTICGTMKTPYLTKSSNVSGGRSKLSTIRPRIASMKHKDENAWIEIVKTVWWAVTVNSEWDITKARSMLELNSIQTQQIEPSLLPISKSTSLPFSKKADLAVAFSRKHPDVGPLVDKVRSRWNDFSLSQMIDAYTQTVPLQCGFEVKECGGDSNEADMQLGIWSAAGLQLLKQQRSAVTGSWEILPFVGGTIVGHEWRVHITWKDENGGVYDVSQWRDLIIAFWNHCLDEMDAYFMERRDEIKDAIVVLVCVQVVKLTHSQGPPVAITNNTHPKSFFITPKSVSATLTRGWLEWIGCPSYLWWRHCMLNCFHYRYT
ncbi:hypothetical protein BDY21DRAFT_39216 [Lineolata rhizophorae]|uniref:PD-(D/E)XK nuclease-like domain-containing protein n=1 Tax=Lineolata rhizophorae TaxID=578093 RepID=A0A6A6P0J4_9PEZI|nr:hypothetical protein BDY21DRAFT_39216 [Lineolata rhizophorae]